MAANEPTPEERILDAMYATLIDVIKDTTTDPRLRHPLSDKTQRNIRDCLDLITARRTELTKARGAHREMRPHYTDEPRDSVAVKLETPKGRGTQS